MVQQDEILEYLKKQCGWLSINEIYNHFEVNKQNITRKIKMLNQFGFIIVRVENRRFMIKIVEEKK